MPAPNGIASHDSRPSRRVAMARRAGQEGQQDAGYVVVDVAAADHHVAERTDAPAVAQNVVTPRTAMKVVTNEVKRLNSAFSRAGTSR